MGIFMADTPDLAALVQGAEEILTKIAEVSPAFGGVLEALQSAKQEATEPSAEPSQTVSPEQGGSGAMPFSHGRPQ